MRILFFISTCFFLFGCKEEQKEIKDPRTATDTLQISFLEFKKPNIILTPATRGAIATWDYYKELSENMQTLDTVSLRFLRLNSKGYLDNAAALVTKTPDSLINNAIRARLLVVYSKMNTTIQEASKLEVDTLAVSQEGTELYNAFQNLKLQLNLKHQKSVEELLEEFEIEADSLATARDTVAPGRTERGTLKPIEN
ncbi:MULTISPECIES: hypothetical protein [unclassified Leeuwenhoekiella]|uniref:hypothetical protein n=1 Tax=unclassified Leeuwenhoekiella TaxID=2615029 RepID=UPI000C5E205C|nr:MULTISPECIES: hypothetical protein [unclassified Leeuwenhoekiella]MAW96155.1 hypothetical protein [Leeuwenhoekiella sp.]MBA80149.1 hypothetical protein [Leeuwenhoekiella sp.]|tara:strand:- start:25264 stop:25854 length:591 start_codon:yes stop_codon:yes gene_type:complete